MFLLLILSNKLDLNQETRFTILCSTTELQLADRHLILFARKFKYDSLFFFTKLVYSKFTHNLVLLLSPTGPTL